MCAIPLRFLEGIENHGKTTPAIQRQRHVAASPGRTEAEGPQRPPAAPRRSMAHCVSADRVHGARRPSRQRKTSGYRAYLRYLERGGNDGGEFDDWLYAERELKKN